MAYERNEWQCGDDITAEKLNNIEDGIEQALSIYECEEAYETVFDDDMTAYDIESSIAWAETVQGIWVVSRTAKVTVDGTEYVVEGILDDFGTGVFAQYGSLPDPDTGEYLFDDYPFFIESERHAPEYPDDPGGYLSMGFPGIGEDKTYSVKIESLELEVTPSPCFEKAVKTIVGEDEDVPQTDPYLCNYHKQYFFEGLTTFEENENGNGFVKLKGIVDAETIGVSFNYALGEIDTKRTETIDGNTYLVYGAPIDSQTGEIIFDDYPFRIESSPDDEFLNVYIAEPDTLFLILENPSQEYASEITDCFRSAVNKSVRDNRTVVMFWPDYDDPTKVIANKSFGFVLHDISDEANTVNVIGIYEDLNSNRYYLHPSRMIYNSSHPVALEFTYCGVQNGNLVVTSYVLNTDDTVDVYNAQ